MRSLSDRRGKCFVMLAIAATACALGCVATAPPPTGRFAILATNALVPIPPELSGARSRVLGQITSYLDAKSVKRFVIDPLETRRHWVASIAEAEASETGSRDFHSAIEILARKLGGPAVFDALIVPSIVFRDARLHHRRVKWDGVVRRLRNEPERSEPGSRKGESLRVPESFDAAIPAVSLHVMVFDAQGKRLFENYGGLDLAHTLTLDPGGSGELHVEPVDPVLADHRYLREGIEVAFDPYLRR